MRIGIDARLYHTGLGIGRYIEQLIKHLERIDDTNEYSIFLRKDAYVAYHPAHPRFKKVLADIPWYSVREQLVMPFLLARYRLDLVHFPHFNVPVCTRIPFIVTIHDLIMIKFPLSATSAASTRNPFIHRVKYYFYRCILSYACRKARNIITVSQHVRNDLVRLLGVDLKKISVIYEAATLPHGEYSGELPFQVKTPYIFSAGNAYPHKNLETLLKAFAVLIREKKDIHLVLCGQEDYFYRRLLKRINEMGLEGRVIHLGLVSDEVLDTLYRNAVLYVFPSYEEGFGLPGLEAMQRGIPVVASRSSCLGEIYGDAAVYIDPSNSEDMYQVMLTYINDSSLRNDLIRKGRERVKHYSWEQTAEQTHLLYTHV